MLGSLSIDGLHTVIGRQPLACLGPVDRPVDEFRQDPNDLVDIADELASRVTFTVSRFPFVQKSMDSPFIRTSREKKSVGQQGCHRGRWQEG